MRQDVCVSTTVEDESSGHRSIQIANQTPVARLKTFNNRPSAKLAIEEA